MVEPVAVEELGPGPDPPEPSSVEVDDVVVESSPQPTESAGIAPAKTQTHRFDVDVRMTSSVR